MKIKGRGFAKQTKKVKKTVVRDLTRQIVRQSLEAQEAALVKALTDEGLEPTKDILSRVVRVKFRPLDVDPPVVKGMFILDKGQPEEKVLFYYQEPDVKSPSVKIWFPGEIDVQVKEDAETAVRMIPKPDLKG